MCEPSTALLAASLALSATSMVTTIQGQNYAANAQEAQQAELSAANNAEAANNLSQLRIQQAQARESSAREGEKARLASQRATATATTAAGESGTRGQSVDAMLQEYAVNFGQFKEASLRQRQIEDAAYEDQAIAIRQGARYSNLRINAPVTGANVAGAALNFGAQALGAFRDYNPDAFKKTSAPAPKPGGGKS